MINNFLNPLLTLERKFEETIGVITSSKWKDIERKFEETIGVITSSKWKDRQHNGKKENKTNNTIIYKTLHRKLKIEQHESH
jgi:hypothetical protein